MRTRFHSVLSFVIAITIAGCGSTESAQLDLVAACGQTNFEIGAFVEIPAGKFTKGADAYYPEESPTLDLHVDGFWIQQHEVTNAQFNAFVEATGYVTDAEQGVIDGREGAGSAVFLHPDQRDADAAPWTLLMTANWRAPLGTEDTANDRMREPVVHISKRDAEAYAMWAGGRLPSEVEWEYAATLGLPDAAVSTSGAYGPDGPRANTWQGIFPVADIATDGYPGVAPVGCFEADRIGLHDMIGNVWEWTNTPYGPQTHTMKGGSFLCADNFCRRYRPAARHPQETDFSSNHIGFRIVRDTPL